MNKNRIQKLFTIYKFKNVILLIFLCVATCGRAYFPIEITNFSRADLKKGQENIEIELVPMGTETIKEANRVKYVRRVIKADDLTKPAVIVPFESLFKERLPNSTDPGPYKLGIGDVLSVATLSVSGERGILRNISVSDEGTIKLFGFGKIRVEGLTQSELEDIIFRRSIDNEKLDNFEIAITGFNSKRIFLNGDTITPETLPYTNYPMYLEDAIAASELSKNEMDIMVNIIRANETYMMLSENISRRSKYKVRLFPDDKIYFSKINYRKETVLVVGETGAQRSVIISGKSRNTLSDVLFNSPTLDKVTSDFSQIYVLRKLNEKFNAYHLDITNPARIYFANLFEMRPGDIVFVGTQPLSLYSRTLSQILGSAGLTIQARDTIRSEVR